MTDSHTGSPIQGSSSRRDRPAYRTAPNTPGRRPGVSHPGTRGLGLKPDMSRVLRPEEEA